MFKANKSKLLQHRIIHSKFLMSMPVWSRDLGPNVLRKPSRKPPFTAPQPTTVSVAPLAVKKGDWKDKEANKIVSELLSDLQCAINDKNKLKSECESLKSELIALRNRNATLEQIIETSKEQFQKEFNRLKEEVKANEENMINNSKKCLQEQKRFQDELKRIKSENNKLRVQNAKLEIEFSDRIKSLENELKDSKASNHHNEVKVEEALLKCNKYKNKLRYAVSIINELNNILIQTTAAAEAFDVSTQTADFENSKDCQIESASKNVPKSCQKVACCNNENLLLSDIFFRAKSFSDNELVIIDPLAVQ